MATVTVSNKYKLEKGKKTIDHSSDIFKIALMASGFTFDPDTHGTWADVSASEISTSGGYTTGGEMLSVSSAWQQDNVNDKAAMSFSNHTFIASGADYDASAAAIVYDDTHVSKVVVGAIEFEEDKTVFDGNAFEIRNIGINDE